MNYESPEAVAIGQADEVILGTKIGPEYDEEFDNFTLPVASIIDVD
jgi:hypothetical protein